MDVLADILRKLVRMTAGIAGAGLFSLFTWQLVAYGSRLKSSGQVSTTPQLPIFWVPYEMAFACVVTMLVTLFHLTLFHLLHPGRALLNP